MSAIDVQQSAPAESPQVSEAAAAQQYAQQVHAQYQAERAKRLKPEGTSQYVDLTRSDRFKQYAEDPWLDPNVPPKRPHTDRARVLLLGSGFGALSFAVRLIEAGYKAEDLVFVDSAGGFGGTWYWNRYPGLMCDVESYIYMPLLEETGYVPKHRYAYGRELRAYTNLVAEKWNLTDKAIFSSTVKETVWDDTTSTWKTTISLDRFGGEDFNITSDAVIVACGILNSPKVPEIPGIDDFAGHIFHTSRWDYKYTGGSPENFELPNLKDKQVAILGTGATAIQAVPELAKWAKDLYVFQRTPSAVDERGQRETDPSWFKELSSKKGWQKGRGANFAARMSNIPDTEDQVMDAWTSFPSYSALIGGPGTKDWNRENVGQRVGALHALDFPRQERVRARVDSLIEDKETAKALKHWYNGWCKRPTFHDDYLPAFNKPNVHLIDTAGSGVSKFTKDALVFNGKEYPVDLLVLSTGYLVNTGSPAARAGMKIVGRNGLTMDQKWGDNIATLHGITTRDLPNLFFAGTSQAGTSANYTAVLDLQARHTAHILGEALKRYGGKRFVVEPTKEAEEAWTMRVMPQAISFATLIGCTPSYITMEGEIERERSLQEQMKGARGAVWSYGFLDYQDVLEQWQQDGKLEGLELRAVE